ncbi:MAG: hypothetical protein ACWGOX_02605 [Desulforhopalus sp.]
MDSTPSMTPFECVPANRITSKPGGKEVVEASGDGMKDAQSLNYGDTAGI